MTITTAQAFRLCGLPSADVFWSLVRRHPRLRKFLLRVQRGGSLWDPAIVDAATAAYRAQRGRWPHRVGKTSIRSQLRNLPRLTDQQRAAVEAKLKGLEADWLAARTDEERATLMKAIRLQRRILRRDDRRKAAQ